MVLRFKRFFYIPLFPNNKENTLYGIHEITAQTLWQ